MASPTAYDAVRYVGALYLLVLAVKAWRAGPAGEASGARQLSRAVRRGFVTNALNPKVALFVLAFLPQFTDPSLGPIWQQILFLGALFLTAGFFITAGYGVLGGAFGQALGRATGWLGKLAALVFAGLAARLLLD